MSKYDKSKFYWLQLKEDFFDEDAINWLEEQPNGKEYCLFYIKLCLKSLKTNAIMIRKVGQMLVPYDCEKLAELTKTKVDTVVIAMKLLTQIGLVKILKNGEIYLTKVEKMIGVKSVGAFKKEQQRFIGGGQMSATCPPFVRHLSADCPPEKEIELDIELDNRESIEKNIRSENETQIELLKEFIPPTLEQIKEFANERGNKIDPKKFFEFYEAGKWQDSKGQPVRNWQQKYIMWENTEKNKPIKAQKESQLEKAAKRLGAL